MAYTKQIWHDLPQTDTPINATRLTHIEDGIESVEQEIPQVLNTNSNSTTDTYSCDYINKKTVNIYDNASGTSSSITFDGNYEDYDYLIISCSTGTGIARTETNSITISNTQYSDTLYQNYTVISFSYNSSTQKTTITNVRGGSYYSGSNHSVSQKIYKIVGVKL